MTEIKVFNSIMFETDKPSVDEQVNQWLERNTGVKIVSITHRVGSNKYREVVSVMVVYNY